ncbi:MAG: GNAT family N-acetyltransferase [Oscillospiraceae bacterium]|nr:GNAT family N-acetyltransferase [Oscillospiraceae bacterium]
MIIKAYTPSMQPAIEACFKACLDALGWEYEPDGRHSDIVNIEEAYMRHGCFWCLYEDDNLVGMSAARCIDAENKIVELKRLYVLPSHQGKGYGDQMFQNALEYVKGQGYRTAMVDTRHDRSASLHLIEKYGFKQAERYNDNDYAELFFELDLTV